MTIAFIGLGHMGLPMALNLLKAGKSLTGFDLSEDALKALEAAGGQVANSAKEAATGADIVITMLPSGALVRQVLEADGVFEAARKGALFIDSSTIDVKTAQDLAEKAVKYGHDFVDAPVSGGVSGAAAGTLAFMVGGQANAFMRAKQLLDLMGKKIIHAGVAGSGQAAKLCNNMLLAISMVGVSEAFTLARALGLDDQVFYDIASGSSGQCWSLTSYCPAPGPVPAAPSNRDFAPGFATALMMKDLRLAMEAVEISGAFTPLGRHAHDLYAMMMDKGYAGKDFSAVIEYLKPE